MTLLNDFLQSPDEITDPTEKAKVEMQRYMTNIITNQYDSHGHLDPLVWRKQDATCYPCLALLARKYLAIPATSVPAERAFNLTGHLVNEKRASFLPETVNMLSFLGANLK